MTWTDKGKRFGVSDNAIRKWAKFYGIEIGFGKRKRSPPIKVTYFLE